MSQKTRLQSALAHVKLKTGAFTQVETAAVLGYNPNYLSGVVNGSVPLSERFISTLESKFGINPEWLLTGEGEMLNPVSHNNDLADFYRKRHEDADDTYKLVKKQGELILEYGKEIQLVNKQIGVMLLMIGSLVNELKRVDPQNELAEKASKFIDSQLSQINANSHGEPQNPDKDKE